MRLASTSHCPFNFPDFKHARRGRPFSFRLPANYAYTKMTEKSNFSQSFALLHVMLLHLIFIRSFKSVGKVSSGVNMTSSSDAHTHTQPPTYTFCGREKITDKSKLKSDITRRNDILAVVMDWREKFLPLWRNHIYISSMLNVKPFIIFTPNTNAESI